MGILLGQFTADKHKTVRFSGSLVFLTMTLERLTVGMCTEVRFASWPRSE